LRLNFIRERGIKMKIAILNTWNNHFFHRFFTFIPTIQYDEWNIKLGFTENRHGIIISWLWWQIGFYW